ncbi:kinesin-13A-like [Dorcoceras hygrometricum]|uniref:Kinesin-13A-like n=1 Tax=Dorcoceras hygrometricum TaxID=472368 RepID=A0A2Z7C0S3_9LAMI|nr:kinesin-13A-like [Dorcoceras hygrometricum]
MAATNWAIWVATTPIDVIEFRPANELLSREVCQVGRSINFSSGDRTVLHLQYPANTKTQSKGVGRYPDEGPPMLKDGFFRNSQCIHHELIKRAKLLVWGRTITRYVIRSGCYTSRATKSRGTVSGQQDALLTW